MVIHSDTAIQGNPAPTDTERHPDMGYCLLYTQEAAGSSLISYSSTNANPPQTFNR